MIMKEINEELEQCKLPESNKVDEKRRINTERFEQLALPKYRLKTTFFGSRKGSAQELK